MKQKPPKEKGGSTENARRLKSNRPSLTHERSPGKRGEINETFGPPELRVWRYCSGVCRIQTRSPVFARKLAQRSKARLVGYSVSGGYLRIFQEKMTIGRGRKLVARYVK